MSMNSEVFLNEFGFYSVKDKPSEEELKNYYEKRYYQSASGSYELTYSPEEIEYFRNKIIEKVHVAAQFVDFNGELKVIDIGCGEGWVLDYFRKKMGSSVVGLDFSSFGCRQFNPDCLECLVEGDIYASIEDLLNDHQTFNVIWLDNVLEHVIDPLDLLRKCRSLLANNGILIVEVPNDFSLLQNHLLVTRKLDKPYWVVVPDHLSYFNRSGLENIGAAAGLRAVFSMGDFPIDLNLINQNTNYYLDKTKGKSCYAAKVEFENLIHSVSVEGAINFYKSLMDLGIGRCLTTFFTKE